MTNKAPPIENDRTRIAAIIVQIINYFVESRIYRTLNICMRMMFLSNIAFVYALKSIPRESYYIGSKVGRYEKDTAGMFDFSAEKTEAGLDNTLNLLGLEYVDLIQRAVKDGKARFIGIADYDIDLMKEIVEECDVKISTILSYAKSTLCDNRLQNYTKYFKLQPVWACCQTTALNLGTLLVTTSRLSVNKPPNFARFFDKITLHWDDVELPAYKAKLNELQNQN
ncbi:unnamed protein product [Leptidea sinapis]|uniref:NADP-dependent oxidoreductase domain-containing protein n=1 Tax=Leptidea sinapis TaxID=189913 RepID=A0A5E4QWQ4_9NEOP|nr:unnamed protein product [Leptidea sinapis]